MLRSGLPAIGFAPDVVHTAFEGMRVGGGHAIRHLERTGLLPSGGRLAERVVAFITLVTPILQHPMHSFDWRIGGTATKGFASIVAGQWVTVLVAKEGPYQGRVVSAFVPDAQQRVLMGLD